jgi:uncharacterized protein (TIGR03435 family)
MVRMTTARLARNLHCSRKLKFVFAGCMAFMLPAMLAQSASSGPPCDPGPNASAQSASPALTYDVASIKPHKAGDGSLSFNDPPHAARFIITGMTMKNLIEIAYGVQSYQVSGGPAWLESQRWDLQAKSDSAADEQLAKLSNCEAEKQKQRMLQALLVDRVKLAVHRGTREGPAYNMVVAKSGPKLQQSKPPDPAATGEPAGARRESGMETRGGPRGMELTARETSMLDLAYMLIAQLHCPVMDKTALTGAYDFKLQWSLDESGASTDSPWPSIFTAVQEQLGLKLEATKTQVETILIDHAEMPSEN